MVARAVHDHSIHSDEPFIAVNCTALTDTLLESELFGHVRGAFTGAVGGKRGYFELAGRGTIFLDEIGDTSPDFQSKLLRVLQERQYYPVGGEQPKTTEARVVAATHQPMEELVSEGGFRRISTFVYRSSRSTSPACVKEGRTSPCSPSIFLGVSGARRAPRCGDLRGRDGSYSGVRLARQRA